MQRRVWPRLALAISVLALGGNQLPAQPQVIHLTPVSNTPAAPPAPIARLGAPVAVAAPPTPITTEAAQPIVAPPIEGLTMEACLELAEQHQPALAAARASLNAAHIGSRALSRHLIIPSLVARDLPIRRQQAGLGVTIADASLLQVEWETRYSVKRNFFTVQYVRLQQQVIEDVMADLIKARKRAKAIFDAGDPNSKINALDLEAIDTQYLMVKANKAKADNGMLKAQAALREAMGVRCDFPLNLLIVELPPPVYKLDKESLIASALHNRGEIAQAGAASQLTTLEIEAQRRIRGFKGNTFAVGADIHAKQIPQGIFNNEYRPGAIGIEMPALLVGKQFDRVDRACALNDRAYAVVDKTFNLVSLDVEAMYLKLVESAEQIRELTEANKLAQPLLDKIIERSNKSPSELTSSSIIQASTNAVYVRTQLNEARHMHALALVGLERATAGAFAMYPVPGPVPGPVPVQKK